MGVDMANVMLGIVAGAFALGATAAAACAQSVEKRVFARAAEIKERDCDRVQVTLDNKLVAEIKVGEAVILTKPVGDIGEKCSAYPGGGTSSNFGFACSLAIVQFRSDGFVGKWVLDISCYQ